MWMYLVALLLSCLYYHAPPCPPLMLTLQLMFTIITTLLNLIHHIWEVPNLRPFPLLFKKLVFYCLFVCEFVCLFVSLFVE